MALRVLNSRFAQQGTNQTLPPGNLPAIFSGRETSLNIVGRYGTVKRFAPNRGNGKTSELPGADQRGPTARAGFGVERLLLCPLKQDSQQLWLEKIFGILSAQEPEPR